ncbi:hypothetical protein CVT24_002452 [Panaeolus cyanescens]|uniref:Uncharacterized protein n=1 Tax=Panaeolus cyanescens TaxID=181874 RepID=A0A409YZ42_9AGAR|nr:hypothetical protein CVT24_002452 [Panaeolus cyanescens]
MASFSLAGHSKRHSPISFLEESSVSVSSPIDSRMHASETPSWPNQPEFQEGSSSWNRSTEDPEMANNRHADTGQNERVVSPSEGAYPIRMDVDMLPPPSSTQYHNVHNFTMQPEPWPFPAPQPEAAYIPPRSLPSHFSSHVGGSSSRTIPRNQVVQSSYSSLARALDPPSTRSNFDSTSSRPAELSPPSFSELLDSYSASVPQYLHPYTTSHSYTSDIDNYAQAQAPIPYPPNLSSQSQSVTSQDFFYPVTDLSISSMEPQGSSQQSSYPSYIHDAHATGQSIGEKTLMEVLSSPDFDTLIQQKMAYLNSEAMFPVPDSIPTPILPSISPFSTQATSTVPSLPVQPLSLASVDDTNMPLPQILSPSYMQQLMAFAPPPIPSPVLGPNRVQHSHYRPSVSRRGSAQHYSEVDASEGPETDDDLDKFIQVAANSDRFDDNATIDEASKQLGLNNLQEKLPGMEVTLMPHQILGVAWMLDKEKGPMQGGCLADEMGLGKTIQMIATMVTNRSKNQHYRSTLIIAPVALLDQWQREIEEKTNCGLTCFKYHGQSKPISKSELSQYDVVLTTYGTMSHEWPDYEKEVNAKARARRKGENYSVGDDDEEMKSLEYRNQKRRQNAGLLFQVEWYRVVADEAQNIRNRKTRMSRAITDLSATYRWCLTGTPVVNSLTDSYGYLRFLRIRPWYEWKEFNDHVARLEKKRTQLAVKRLQAINATFLLRRKKDSQLDGKALVQLPEKEVKLVRLEFTAEERQIYDMVERKSQAKFNRFLKAGTVLKHYHRVLVLLLRLRQICAHPSLIQEDGKAFINGDEDDDDSGPIIATELTRARGLVSAEFVNKLKARLKQEALDRIQAEKDSEGNADATVDEDDCPICYEPMTDAVFTACAHAFCRECIKAFITQRGKEEATTITTRIEKPCPVCRRTITEEKLFLRSAFEPAEEELNPVSDDTDVDMDAGCHALQPGIDKGKAKAQEPESLCAPRGERDQGKIFHQGDGNSVQTAIVLDSDDEGPDMPEDKGVIFGHNKKSGMHNSEQALTPKFLPSSKMKYMMEQIQELARLKPNEKFLVVSQWTACLALVSDYLTEKNIPHVKYQGDMTSPKREQAVQVFMAKDKAKIMLMSLKCGGVGLNLTRANNVISLDLGWSPAVESQAFDRVHRVGQTKRVLVQRIVIAGTVEDRILEMQQRKQTLADGSLGEGSGNKIGKLSVRELANLFGLDRQGRRLAE